MIKYDNQLLRGCFIAVGEQGSGKTAFITKLAIDNLKDRNYRIFSNYTFFNINYKKITLGNQKEKEKGAIDILETLDKDKNYFNNSIVCLDEIHIYLDAYDYFKKNNRRMQTFFSQLRKRNILLLATSQDIMNVDIRVRRQTRNFFEMEQISNDIFEVTTYKMLEAYYPTMISKYRVILNDYFKYYDTNEIIE
jgi:ABC-type dipeptide/oligopeptide/nickel transport system ATPase component